MADTALATASRVQKWDAAFLAEYVRDSRFMPYMGNAGRNPMMPIMVKSELTSAGKTVNIPLITRLKGNGVQGNTALVGFEEALGNYNHPVNVHYNRNGVSVPEPDQHWTEMDLREASRMMLRTWAAEALRDDIIIALLSTDGTSYVRSLDATNATGTVRTPSAFWTNISQASLDAWLLANRDRVSYGGIASLMEADSDHSDSVVKLTTGTHEMRAATITEAKRLAKTADPHIRPIRTDDANGREYYVMFMSSEDFGNAKLDATIAAYNKDARPREVDSNPIFQDGDMIYDGVILREVPEIPSLGLIGASTSLVTTSFLCGAQALSVAWGMKPQSRVGKEDDYGHFSKLAITECRGVSKNFFNGKQHGVVTVFSSAA
jgi:hypothetical protein